MSISSQQQWTILDILKWTTNYFREKQIDSPRLTAEVLLAHTLDQERIYLYTHFDQPLDSEERTRFRGLIKQRVQGVPTQYLVGKQEFWSMDFQVSPAVLIPRPETEHLVEAALKLASKFSTPTIVDIGTGSGILAISLKKELPQAIIHATDLSEQALTVAQRNAANLLNGDQSITFHHGDLFAPFEGLMFDIIVSNPPYIADTEYAGLAREIRDHEPRLALHGGKQGLDVYERLIPDAWEHLNPGGYMLVEMGANQKNAVTDIFQTSGFTLDENIKDYAGLDRVLVAHKPTGSR